MNIGKPGADMLADILDPLNIRTIVCIDDVYMKSGELPIEAVLTVIASGLMNEEQRSRIESVFPDVEFGDPLDEDWRLSVREVWQDRAESDREGIGNLLAEVTGSVIDEDRESVSQLQSLTEALPDVNLVELSPVDWLEKSSSILAAASAETRILCLFDQDLQNAGLGADGGLELIEGVIKANQPLGVPNVICGLLSHTFSKEDEEDRWRQMASGHRLNLSQVLPISKERLDSPEEFAGGVAQAIINSCSGADERFDCADHSMSPRKSHGGTEERKRLGF